MQITYMRKDFVKTLKKNLGQNYNLYVKIGYFWLMFSIICKTGWGKTVNLSVRIYINNVEKRITFKIQARFYHELLTP